MGVYLYKHCLPKTGEHWRFDCIQYASIFCFVSLFLFSIVAVYGNVHIKISIP